MPTPWRHLPAALLAVALAAAPPAHAADEVTRAVAHYSLPDVTLVNQKGDKVKLRKLFDPARPLLLQFIFTSCQAICPVMGATFASVQTRIGPTDGAVDLVSVSIDPDYDTPARMKAFLDKFHATPTWSFLTGSRRDVVAVQKAFEAYTANKMGHAPLTFLWSPAEKAWIRIGGFIAAGELYDQFRNAAGK